MVDVYRNHTPEIVVYKDAQELLLKLKKEYRIGLITDGLRKVQEGKVKALKIKCFFDVVTYAIEHGGKNTTSAFQVTLEKLKVNPQDSIYIDDNPLKGFDIAKKLGIHTVRILKGEHRDFKADERHKPEFEVEDLQQLFNLISS